MKPMSENTQHLTEQEFRAYDKHLSGEGRLRMAGTDRLGRGMDMVKRRWVYRAQAAAWIIGAIATLLMLTLIAAMVLAL